MDNYCVSCGRVIPEGRQVCAWCETDAQERLERAAGFKKHSVSSRISVRKGKRSLHLVKGFAHRG